MLVGVVLDWLATGAAYDLLDFCQKICQWYEGSGKRLSNRWQQRLHMLIAAIKQVRHCQEPIFKLIPIPNEFGPTWLLILHVRGSYKKAAQLLLCCTAFA